MRRGALIAVALATTITTACGSDSGSFGAGNPSADGGGLIFGSGGSSMGGSSTGGSFVVASNGGASGSAVGGASGAGTPPCTGAGCVATPNPAGKAANAPCTAPSQCQTGRCEPAVTGVPGEICLGACFADGVACTRALDCCSTGCHGGVCVKALCTLEGDDCSTNADCCSNLCSGGRCTIDRANRDCRPTGEDCTSGTGSGCCNQCDDATGRCAFGPDTCFAQGVACHANTDCCFGACIGGVCKTPCAANGSACATAGDCCSAACSSTGTCVPKTLPPPAGNDAGTGMGTPPPAVCTPTGGRCTKATDCCSTVCFGGFCERAPA